nr:hypothetical protein [Deltaproteobacteria bacterium]
MSTKPVIASRDVIAAARTLPWATTDGIPMVIIPKKHMAAWRGIGTGEHDSEDYDRACAVRGVGVIAVGAGTGLVISQPGGMAFWPTETGGLIIIWIGAESRAGCIAAALSIADTQWENQNTTFVVDKGAEKLVMFDSGSAGKSMKSDGKIGPEGGVTATFELAAGTYAIDAVWSQDVKVKIGRKAERTLVG